VHVAAPHDELHSALRISFTACYRSLPRCLYGLKQLIATLLAKYIADERTKHVHVFAQVGIFDGKNQVLTGHGDGVLANAITGSWPEGSTCAQT